MWYLVFPVIPLRNPSKTAWTSSSEGQVPSAGGGRREESIRHLLVGDGVMTLVSPRRCSSLVWKHTRPANLSLSAVSWHSPGSIGSLGEEH